MQKALDCLNHDILVVLKPYASNFAISSYFNTKALIFIQDYLSNRSQRTKINSEYSSYRDIKYGVLQGSILGPLLFNIFLNDIFFLVKDSKITNYADDNTLYAVKQHVIFRKIFPGNIVIVW